MKLSFKNISIRYKLLLIILFVTTLALIAAFLFTYYFQREIFLERVQKNLYTQARIIAGNNTAALNFNDTMASRMILETMVNDTNILQAVLFNARYNIFSFYKSDTTVGINKSFVQTLKPGEALITGSEINILVSVSDETSPEEVIGYLYIKRSLKDFNVFLNRFVLFSLILMLSLLAFTIIMAQFLQKIISRPIMRLSQLTNTITKTRNYKTSLPYHADDETGKLVLGFNEMLKTIDSQNEDLVAAREEAIRNARVKEEFLANMSHEIRTPLNVIVGLSNILIDTSLNDEQKKYLKNIKTASDNVLLIVNDILDYSKISSGKIEFERIEFPVIEVVNEVIDSFKVKSDQKNLELKLFTGPGIPGIVVGDRLKLYQILTNLVSNSFKFTNQGYIHIFIELEKETDLIYNLVFRVRDTGIGIPLEKQSLVFESFRQASNDTTRKYGGTGLGLAICRQLVELQGGKIGLESRPGQGTTFNFNIMYNKPDATPVVEKIIEEPGIEFEKLKRAKVLVIEDNPMNIMVVQALLKKAGVSVIHAARNGIEAKEYLVNNTYNIVLMDINLEDTNGFILTRFIREDLAGVKRNTPVIAFTGLISLEEREKYVSSGMNDFIPKPFNPKELYSKLNKYISNK